jgi:ribosomal protein S18 acetylase RimI-like enzyme
MTGPVDGDWLAAVRARAAAVESSLLLRVATRVVPVVGGSAVLLDSAPHSQHHNRLILDGPVDAETIVAEADRTLSERPFRRALLSGAAGAAAPGLAARGWEQATLLLMAARPRRMATGPAREATAAGVRPFRDACWREQLPDAADDVIAQLSTRYEAEAGVVDVRHLAVCEGGEVVAAALLKIDRPTANLDALETSPAHRGRGYGDALLALAFDLSAREGCDLLALSADADDWPQAWYARRGFAVVDRQIDAAGSTGQDERP